MSLFGKKKGEVIFLKGVSLIDHSEENRAEMEQMRKEGERQNKLHETAVSRIDMRTMIEGNAPVVLTIPERLFLGYLDKKSVDKLSIAKKWTVNYKFDYQKLIRKFFSMGLIQNKYGKLCLTLKGAHEYKVGADSDRQQRFSNLTASSQKNIREGKLGLYRSDLLGLAGIAAEESRPNDELLLLSEVCYFDCFGYGSLEEYRFMLEDGASHWKPHIVIAPGVVNRISSVCKVLDLDAAGFKAFFVNEIKPTLIPEPTISPAECASIILLYIDGKREEAENKIASYERRFIRAHKGQ